MVMSVPSPIHYRRDAWPQSSEKTVRHETEDRNDRLKLAATGQRCLSVVVYVYGSPPWRPLVVKCRLSRKYGH